MRNLRRLTVCVLVTALAFGAIPHGALAAATGTIAPFPRHQFFDNNGLVCNGCKLFTYTAGTSTKVSTFTDVALSSANTNPIVLDSSGRAVIFLTPGVSYKFILAPSTDSDPPVAPIWSIDSVSAVPPSSSSADVDVAATAGATIASGDLVCLSDGGGGNTSGRWYPCDADFTFLSNLAPATGVATAAISTGSTGTVRRIGRVTGLSALVAGTLYYASATAGALTSTKPTNARAVGTADSTTTLILAPTDIDASSTFSGNVSTGAQTFAGVKTFPSAPVLSLGATYASGTTMGNFFFARSSSNVTKNNNTTFGDVTGINFAVLANSTYVAYCTAYWVSTAAADIKFTFTGPAAATAVQYGSVTAADIAGARTTAFGSAVSISGSGVDTVSNFTMILRNGANAGTVQLQMAQFAGDVSNTVVYADSYCTAMQVQ